MGSINPGIYGAYLNGQNAGMQELQNILAATGRNRMPGPGMDINAPMRGSLPSSAPVAVPAAAQPVAPAPDRSGSLRDAQIPQDNQILTGLFKKSGLLLSQGDVEGAAKLYGEAHKLSEESYKRDFTIALNQLSASNGQDVSGYAQLINKYKERFGFEAADAGFDPKSGKLWMDVRRPGMVSDPGDEVPTAKEGPDGEMVFSNPGAYKKPQAAPTQRVEFTAEELNNRLYQMFDPEKGFTNFANIYAKARERNPQHNFLTVKGAEGDPERVYTIGPDGRSLAPAPGLDTVANGPRPLPNKTANDVRSAVMGLYKISDMAGMDPATQGKLGNAMTYASALLQANKGSPTSAMLDVNTAARLGSDLAEGKVKETRFKDGQGQVWRGIEWNGKKLMLDVQPEGTGAGMKVPPATQASRDTDAGRVMAGEYSSPEAAKAGLAELDKAITQAKDPTVRQILQSERSRLSAGLSTGPTPGATSPDGLPAGARQIGTSGGKPVYQTPDGKKFIGE